MSFRAKRELLVQVAPRYRAARHGQRSAILDEFVAVTGYERKYAIRLLLGPIRPPEPIRRQRAPQYGVEVQQALAAAWRAPPCLHLVRQVERPKLVSRRAEGRWPPMM